MKPFNLAEALAGKPVVNGRMVLAYHTADGNTPDLRRENEYTLYMAPVEKEAWVNLYRAAGAAFHYPTREEADASAGPNRTGGKAFHLVYEE